MINRIRMLKTGGASIKPPRKYKKTDIAKAIVAYYNFPVEECDIKDAFIICF